MEIGDWAAPGQLASLYQETRDLGLESNVAELEAFGFTVVQPEQTGAPELVDRLIARLVEISADRNEGVKPDLEGGTTHTDMLGPTGQHLFYLLVEDPAFEEALMHPMVLALVTYLMGPDVILSSCTATLKGPGRRPLFLHSDSPVFSGRQANVANATWVLSDYTKQNGSLCLVPGSHRANRQPSLGENFATFQSANGNLAGDWGTEPGVVDEAPGAIAIEAARGSLVVWHGNTWHGAYNRVTPGMRMNLIYYFCSPHLRPQEPYREFIPQEILDRNSPRFARLMGAGVHYGWRAEGPERGAGLAFKRRRARAIG